VAEEDRRRLRVDVTVTKAWERRGRTTGLDLEYAVSTPEGAPVATAHSSFSWMVPDAWRRLRERGRAAHGLGVDIGAPDRQVSFPPAESAGRGLPGNVIIADMTETAGGARGRVVVDPGNAAMFEHPQDHIPGMVQLEAARQAAIWTLARATGRPPAELAVRGVEGSFLAVGELDIPVHATATLEGADRVAVEFVQSGVELGRAVVDLIATGRSEVTP
jgi:hypothetical protein